MSSLSQGTHGTGKTGNFRNFAKDIVIFATKMSVFPEAE